MYKNKPKNIIFLCFVLGLKASARPVYHMKQKCLLSFIDNGTEKFRISMWCNALLCDIIYMDTESRCGYYTRAFLYQ